MARNTLEAVFGALGAGLRGYGQDVSRRREMEQAEIARQDELARTLAERQLRIFQSGLEEAAPAADRARNVGQFGQMAQAAQVAMPGPMSAVGRALQSAGSAMQTDIQRGRRTTIGGTEYVQPFSRTTQAQQARAQESAADRAARAAEKQADIDLQDRLMENRLETERIRARAAGEREGAKPPARPTGEQEKSFAFAERMVPADEIIQRYGPTARLDRITAALAVENPMAVAAVNRTLTPEEQQLVTAIRQFAEPILRKNTGAAFGRQEIRWVEQQVIPLSGDSKDVQDFKARVRQREIETMRTLATPAIRYYEWAGQNPSAAGEVNDSNPDGAERPPLDSFFRRP